MATRTGYHRYLCYLVVRGTDKTKYLEKYKMDAMSTIEAREKLKHRFLLGTIFTWVFEEVEYVGERGKPNKEIIWVRE